MHGLEYEYRTGIGTDIHRLIEGLDLMLGGIHIPFGMGLKGHSDGDAVLHAVIDATLGAASMGDIGTLFPDTDEKWKDADSKMLLMMVRTLLEDERWETVNVDLIVHAEQPKLEAFKGHIKRSVAELLGINFVDVNVKAKTNEGLDAVGEGRAIAATAITLIRRRLKRTL
ncbi:MAG: 2-C-methyl-D-erythritol 2,4-cyclodiphosphate synthase [Planctomycetes bacterium]|nr:2-C-methyl-D-erythritol 2,4-cyclodiphosphate synthase [Planctomycetota bacterium]